MAVSQLKTTGQVDVHVNSPFDLLKVTGADSQPPGQLGIYQNLLQFLSGESRPANR